MAVDKKISQLTSLAQVNVDAAADVLPIVDTSATETKKITVSALVGAGATAGISGAVLTSATITTSTVNSTSVGATTPSTGAFTTLSASSTTSLNPANANVSLAPTGTGVVTINPATAGTMNNVAIGGSTAAAGTFTTATATTGNITTVNATTVDATNVEVTNVKAKDGTAAITIADSTGVVSVSTKVEFADGTAAAPTVTNTGDTDTGLYFPAANEAAITTGGTVAAAFNSNGLFFRNRIINGDMRIDQRAAGAVSNPSGTSYSIDRWGATGTVATKFTLQQSTTVPTGAGFINSLLATSSSAYTAGASEAFFVRYAIEGTNVADLGWGTASARTVTLSFWVRSSLTGTFGGSLRNGAANRSYPFTYSISVADTWEYKTVTIPGDTSGTWLTDTGIGMTVAIGLGAGATVSGTAGAWAGSNFLSATGAVSVVATNGATFYITGVQLETGSVATPFERRPYGTELMLCQRYYYRLKATGNNYPFGFAQCYGTTSAGALIPYPVTMRAAPSALEQSGTAADYQLYQAGGSVQACSAVPAYASVLTTTAYGAVNFTVTANIVAGNVTHATGANSTAYLGWSAEL